jgi:hypothetical protein
MTDPEKPDISGQPHRQRIAGVEAEVESGVAFAEAQDLDPAPDDPEKPVSPTIGKKRAADHPDSIDDLKEDGTTPGGQSAGAAYPNPHKGPPRDKIGGVMGHGGQSEMAYHGSGHLGEQTVDDDANRNGVAEHDG